MCEPFPLQVVVLRGLVHKDHVDTTQSRWRCPLHLLVRAWSLIPQHTVDRVNLHVLDTLEVRQLTLERVHKLTRGAYDENAEAPLRGANGHLEQYCRLARARTTRYEEATLVLALLLLVVQGYSIGHRTESLFLAR